MTTRSRSLVAVIAALFLIVLALPGLAQQPELYIDNPLAYTGVITRAAPNHPPNWQNPDLSMDIATSWPPTAGLYVYFSASHQAPIEEVRGVVVEGGTGSLRLACGSQVVEHGGYEVKIDVFALYSGLWSYMGYVRYTHVDNILVSNGAHILNGTAIGRVTEWFGGTCSDGPHVHVDMWNYNNFAGWVEDTNRDTVLSNDPIGCLGGDLGAPADCLVEAE